MVFFEKSQPAPESLKEQESYRGKDVVDRLWEDFKNKCYLCETKAPVGINVEHFHPHNGDVTLKYDWNNLFFSCAHCNNTKTALEEKSASFASEGILDCTNPNDCVDESISYRVVTFFEPTKVILENEKQNDTDYDPRIDNTIKLLDAIYNGYDTPIKTIESENLLKQLLVELTAFHNLIFKYKNSEQESQDEIANQILDSLNNDSAFTAFKRWIVKDDPDLVPLMSIWRTTLL